MTIFFVIFFGISPLLSLLFVCWSLWDAVEVEECLDCGNLFEPEQDRTTLICSNCYKNL